MKANIFLLIVGISLGCFLGLFVGKKILNRYYISQKGDQFESLEDLRSKLEQRGDEDKKEGGSVSFRSIIYPRESDKIIYQLAPKIDVKFQGVNVKTNSCSMRDVEREVKKPEDVFRIALLGDSFAFGWGVEQDLTFAKVLEKTLNDFTNGLPKVEVLNFGVPGYSTFQEVARFEEIGLDFKPDLVLVFFVDNDFAPPFFIKSMADTGEVVDSSKLSGMMKTKDSGERKKLNDFLELLNANRQIQRLLSLSEIYGFPVYLTINPRRAIEKDLNALWILRNHTPLKYISLRERFVDVVKRRDLKQEEISLKGDPHPNAYRHKIYGELLAESLMPELF